MGRKSEFFFFFVNNDRDYFCLTELFCSHVHLKKNWSSQVLLAVKTNIILATVMFLGFLSRPELVISYLPPGMASKINTKGKRLCISLLYFGVLEHAESLADICVWRGVGWGGFFFF